MFRSLTRKIISVRNKLIFGYRDIETNILNADIFTYSINFALKWLFFSFCAFFFVLFCIFREVLQMSNKNYTHFNGPVKLREKKKKIVNAILLQLLQLCSSL